MTRLVYCPGVCRECGCDDEHACVVVGVPCHWIEPDLCSACAPAPAPLELVHENVEDLVDEQLVEDDVELEQPYEDDVRTPGRRQLLRARGWTYRDPDDDVTAGGNPIRACPDPDDD